MKEKILKAIAKEINDEKKYEFYFDEHVSSDTIHVGGEVGQYVFELSLRVWVIDSPVFGIELQDAEVETFQVWDMGGDDVDTDILDAEIIEQLKIF